MVYRYIYIYLYMHMYEYSKQHLIDSDILLVECHFFRSAIILGNVG